MARAQRRRRRSDARRIASRAALRTSLQRDRALGRISASKGGFKRRRKTRHDLAREFAHEDGAVLPAERGDGLVYAVALYEERAVRVDVADGAEDAEEVELHDGFGVGELFGDAAEELGLCDADCDGGRVAADLEEWVEQVLEGACFGGDEIFEERVERLGFR